MGYEQPTGRGLEIIVGLLVAFVALVFWGLVSILATNAGFNIDSVLGGLALVIAALWFTQLAYRLLFNKRNKNGGLFSIGGLRFWCLFLGVCFAMMVPFGIYMREASLIISSLAMLAGCVAGWRIASNRAASNGSKT